MIRVRGDRELRIPFAVEAFREPLDDVESVRVAIHERERGAFEFLRAHDGGERVLAERCRACADDGDLGGEGHVCSNFKFQNRSLVYISFISSQSPLRKSLFLL